jgi:hypothetical protein
LSFSGFTSATRRVRRGSFPSIGCIALALALWCVLAACENSAPARTIASVDPLGAPNTEPQLVKLKGDGFLEIPLVRLSSRERATLRGVYRVELVGPDKRIVIDDVVVVKSTELAFTVPAGHTPDKYDVVVIPPAGDPVVLEDGYVITDGDNPGSPDRLWLETKADGSGEPIDKRKLALRESLDVYAVRRDWKRDVQSVDEVVTFSQEPVLCLLSDVRASHTKLEARLPGETVLRGVSDELGLTASATLTVEGNLADFTLTLENAPNGDGAAFVDDTVSKQIGEQLIVYAVVRERDGAFALAVPASWQVTGELATTAKPGESLTLELDKLGTTTISAEYLGLQSTPLRAVVGAGRATKLFIAPESAELRAGAAPRQFVVSGEDAQGNPTTDVGTLSWSIVDGVFGEFEPTNANDGILTPRRAGTGRFSIQSSYELALTSGAITVLPGELTRLALTPNNLTLSADDDPVQFVASGYDAFDNVTEDLGTLSWQTNGDISFLGTEGELEPNKAGTGSITVTSSLGPAATSGTIEITRGELTTISIQPQTWSGKVGDPAQQFSALGSDSDGNLVPDIGSLSYRIASGAITAINAQTGLFTPTTAGQGTIEVTSSLGLSDISENIVVSPLGATLRISAIRAPSFFWAGQVGARVEVDVNSTDVSELAISGIGLSFSSSTGDRTSYFRVVPDRGNSDRVPAGSTRTLIYYVDTSLSLSTTLALTVSATGEAFPLAGQPFAFAGSVVSSSRVSLTEPSLILEDPDPPYDRVCVGGEVEFEAEADSLFADYEWRIPGSTWSSGSNSGDFSPKAVFSTVGNFVYSVTSTYFGYENTLLGTPIYVGASSAAAADTYPTGHVVFSAPSAGQAIALTGFPRSDLIALSGSYPVQQCNGTAVAATGHRAMTLFSDRDLIDTAADIDALSPGIQVQLTTSGLLGPVPVVAPSSSVEGETTLYAEYFDATSGTVTAAGDSTFRLSGDLLAPAVAWTFPAADCGAACLAPGDSLLFQFSEPMLLSSLNNSRVDVFDGTACTGTATNVTSGATRTYDSAARVLYVKPASRTGTYAIQVQLPTTVTDAASARNALPVTTRCVVFGSVGSAANAGVPQLAAAVPAKLSPDGDGVDDTLTWRVNVDAATSLVRLRITRAGKSLWARVTPVPQAGEYTFVWDGGDETGRIVPDGIYGYAIESVNRAGNASAALRGYVEVDSSVRMVSVRRAQ